MNYLEFKNPYANIPYLLPKATKKEMEIGAKMQDIRSTPKVGRNEPCPCHSGKKFKTCCLTK